MPDRPPVNKPTNMREMHRRTERNLIIGSLIILFVIGGGLIWLLYGFEQALLAEIVMGGLIALFAGVFWIIAKILKALSEDDD